MSGSIFLRFLNDSDETAFRRAQTSASCSMRHYYLVGALISAISYAIYTAKLVPLVFAVGIFAGLSTECFKQSPTLHLVAFWTATTAINLTLSLGVLFSAGGVVPPIVQSGYALPVAVSGTLSCMALGTMLGLRFMRDVLPSVCITLVTSVAHSMLVLPPGGGALHYPIATVAVTLLGCAAEYRNESLERLSWISLADLKSCEGSVSNSEMADAHSWQHTLTNLLGFGSQTDQHLSVVEGSKLPKGSWFVLAHSVLSLLVLALAGTGGVVFTMALAHQNLLMYIFLDNALHGSSNGEAPTAVRDNHPIPYVLLGVSVLVYSAQLMNRRLSKNCATLSLVYFHVSPISLVYSHSASSSSHHFRLTRAQLQGC